MTDSDLQRKAFRLQRIVEEKTVQAHGMIPMFVRTTDYQLPTAEDYAGAYKHRHLLGKSEAEIGIAPMHVWRAWENTSADTAFYLGAMSYQYRCTGDPAALAICRRTLGALKYIHNLGVERGERGFLCKPYGGVYSNQSSGDQIQCVLTGLTAYRPIAPAEDLAAIDLMLHDFARYEITHEYITPHGYFGWTRQRLVEDIFGDNWSKATWSYGIISTTLLYMAWQATGDPLFIREIQRWYAACGTDKRFAPPTGTIKGGLSWRALYLPSLLMEFDPTHHELWRSMMVQQYRILQSGILDNGTSAYNWTYNTDTGQREELPAGLWAGAGGDTAQTGRSAILAMGCVIAQRWLPQEDMTATARHILDNLDLDTFRFVMPTHPEQPVPTSWRIETELLDHDALTAWLWAYWEGHWRGYW